MRYTPQKFDKILFLGTGGGNDIFSTLLAAHALREAGWSWKSCDIAGVLSPFHEHETHSAFEPRFQVAAITPESKRFVRLDKENEWYINFVDAAVARILYDYPRKHLCKNIYGLSLKRGSQGITALLNFFHKLSFYDQVILVDIGGDILYRGPEDSHILSPMFDSMVLKGFTDSDMPGFLFQAGLGTDGELEPDSIHETFTELVPDRYPLSEHAINEWDTLFTRYIKPVRPGRTVPLTIKGFRARSDVFDVPFKARAHFCSNLRWYHEINQVIDTSFHKNFYLVDPRAIKNPFAVNCSNPLEWFMKTQVETPTNCEANLEIYTHQGTSIQLVTPSPLFDSDTREDIIRTVLFNQNERGYSDELYLFRSDFRYYDELTARYSIDDNDEKIIKCLRKR